MSLRFVVTRSAATAIAAGSLFAAGAAGSTVQAQDAGAAGSAKPSVENSFSHTLSIPTIDAVDANVDEAVLKEIFSGNIAGNADALAALDATSITVPEITVEMTSKGEEVTEATLTMTDLVLDNVSDGVAGSITLGGFRMEAPDVMVSYDQFTATDVDIGGMLGLVGLVAGDGSDEMKTIYSSFAAQGGEMDIEDVACTFGETTAGAFRARPLKTSMAEIIAMIQTLEENPDSADSSAMASFVRIYADFLSAYEIGEMTFDGMNCEGVTEEGQNLTFTIASISSGEMTAGTHPSVSLDGLDVDIEGVGTVQLDNFTVKPMDFSGMIAVLENVPDDVDETWLDANATALIPAMEGFALSGFNMDIADPSGEAERITAEVEAFDLTLGNYVNFIPSAVDMSGSGIKLVLPTTVEDEQIQMLIALGVTEIDAGFRLAAAWDEASNTIDIEEISVSGQDLASLMIAGTLGNATKALFTPDSAAFEQAAIALTVQGLDLTLEDYGLSDLLLQIATAGQGGSPEAMRAQFAGVIEGEVLNIMSGMASAGDIGAAVRDFVRGTAKVLYISAQAKDPAGLTAIDFVAAEENPQSLLDKVDLSVSAE